MRSTRSAPSSGTAGRGNFNPRTAERRATTRAGLLKAARTVFERDGFHDARLSDIVKRAHVSIGTFYNYYPSKIAIFRDLMSLVSADLVSQAETNSPHEDDPVGRIEAANRAYVQGYRRHAKLMRLLYEMAERDEEILTLRRDMRSTFELRISRAIRQWQKAGLAWPDLDPVYAANALAYMVDRFLHEWSLLNLDYDEDTVVYTLNRLWARGLGLERKGPAATPLDSQN
jgi:AcrR family transcriptional regulator